MILKTRPPWGEASTWKRRSLTSVTVRTLGEERPSTAKRMNAHVRVVHRIEGELVDDRGIRPGCEDEDQLRRGVVLPAAPLRDVGTGGIHPQVERAVSGEPRRTEADLIRVPGFHGSELPADRSTHRRLIAPGDRRLFPRAADRCAHPAPHVGSTVGIRLEHAEPDVQQLPVGPATHLEPHERLHAPRRGFRANQEALRVSEVVTWAEFVHVGVGSRREDQPVVRGGVGGDRGQPKRGDSQGDDQSHPSQDSADLPRIMPHAGLPLDHGECRVATGRGIRPVPNDLTSHYPMVGLLAPRRSVSLLGGHGLGARYGRGRYPIPLLARGRPGVGGLGLSMCRHRIRPFVARCLLEVLRSPGGRPSCC